MIKVNLSGRYNNYKCIHISQKSLKTHNAKTNITEG